jgi:hypothetical protein
LHIITELITDGGFETPNSGWKFNPGLDTNASRGTLASCVRSDSAYGSLSTQGSKGDPEFGQFIVIPDKGTTTLKFSVRVSSEETPNINVASIRLFVSAGEALANATITTADVCDKYVT